MVMKRQHMNGWVAIVEEGLDGVVLTGYAINPSGGRFDAPANQIEGGGDDCAVQELQAQEANDPGREQERRRVMAFWTAVAATDSVLQAVTLPSRTSIARGAS